MQAMAWNRTFIEWKQLAVGMGAVIVNNFGELIQSINGLIGMVPTARAHLDFEAMKQGRKAFDDAFPDYAKVRFGVAHAGKQFASPEANAKQRLEGVGTYIQNMLTDRTLYSHVNQKEVGYTLSNGSLAALRKSADLIRAAFTRASEESLKYNSRRQRETPERPSEDPDRPR